jgi:hypothetical protein
MKERIKQEIKNTLALYEIARPWKTPRSELAETIAELAAKDILKLINEHERKRTKRPLDGLRDQGASDAGVEQ